MLRPMIHFLLLGALCFGVSRWWPQDRASAELEPITIGAARVTQHLARAQQLLDMRIARDHPGDVVRKLFRTVHGLEFAQAVEIGIERTAAIRVEDDREHVFGSIE